jgi:uncharacterized protein with HEPN domain
MPERDPELLVEDIRTACLKIQRFTDGMTKEAFLSNELVVDAVIRNLTVIGEAAQQMPESGRLSYPDVAWHQIAGMRNRIVHDYAGVDLEIVWVVITENIPELIKTL